MKKRFSIFVREHGSDHDVELMQCDSNPAPLAQELRGKRLNTTAKGGGKRKTSIQKYTWVRVEENFRR